MMRWLKNLFKKKKDIRYQDNGAFGYNSEGIIREADFLPKKDIKSHTLVERKQIFVRPGVYTREMDYSTTVFIPNRERFTEIFGQPE